MSDYSKRGESWLKLCITDVLIGVFFCFFEKLRYYGIGIMLTGVLSCLPAYFVHRSMTPEQFEKRQKKEKMANDERNMLIVYKSCRVSAIVMLLTAWAGLCIFAIYENKPAAWALGAQALVGIAALFIARAVYQAKI